MALARTLLIAAALAALSPAQTNPLTAAVAGPVSAQRGASATAVVRVSVHAGYHVNSNTPGDEFLIPLRLTWEAAPLTVEGVQFPEPRMETFAFSNKPLSVFAGQFEVRTRFRAPAAAPAGNRTLTGKLRYQACTDRLCLPPKTITLELPVTIR